MNILSFPREQHKLFRESYKAMHDHNDLKKSKFTCAIDVAFCMLRYGAKASDYFDYEFYNKKASERKKFACTTQRKKLYHTLNDYCHDRITFDDKVIFLKTFAPYVGRDYLYTPDSTEEEIRAFAENHRLFIAKPDNSSCGVGVKKVSYIPGQEEILKELKENDYLLEELIVQHSEMSKLNASTVNSIRVATVRIGDEVKIFGTALRCGVPGETVDNFRAGGLAAKVDPETGVVVSDGVNVYHNHFYKHPDSHVYFHGFRIPHWDKVLEMVTEAAKVVPGAGYVGWDVAIRQDDVVLIEGNFRGMMGVFQIPTQEGIRDKVERYIKEVEESKKK